MNKRRTIAIRVTSNEHRRFHLLAAIRGQSINEMLVEIVREKASEPGAFEFVEDIVADNDETIGTKQQPVQPG